MLAAALWLRARDPDGLMLVAPSDHVVPDAAAFRAAVAAAEPAARAGQLVTFGIKPDRAETGYGYLELDGDPGDFSPKVIGLKRFVEKPDLATPRICWPPVSSCGTRASFCSQSRRSSPPLRPMRRI
nr:sugar phosphate nucleotidyltransferase [Phaeobacter inhibens]